MVPRFGEFCYCCCLPLLPGLAFRIHATWGPPFSRALHITHLIDEPAAEDPCDDDALVLLLHRQPQLLPLLRPSIEPKGYSHLMVRGHLAVGGDARYDPPTDSRRPFAKNNPLVRCLPAASAPTPGAPPPCTPSVGRPQNRRGRCRRRRWKEMRPKSSRRIGSDSCHRGLCNVSHGLCASPPPPSRSSCAIEGGREARHCTRYGL